MELLSFTLGIFLQWVLEVAGAGGAWWGMSEVWKMRGAKTSDPQESNDRIRIVSNVVFAVAAIRMIFRYAPNWGIKQALVDPHAWILDFGKSTKTQTPSQLGGTCAFEVIFFIIGLFMQFVLEVLGAGGAWWGMSEVWGMRGYSKLERGQETNDQLRWVSNIVFAVACIRFVQHYCPNHPVNTAMCSPHDYDLASGTMQSFQLECIFFTVGVFMQFVLEVLGAGGAWWGMSEVWGLRGYSQLERGQETNDQLRYVSNIVFAIACVRMLEKYVPMNDHHLAMLSPQEWLMDRVNLGMEAGDTKRDEQEQNAEEQM